MRSPWVYGLSAPFPRRHRASPVAHLAVRHRGTVFDDENVAIPHQLGVIEGREESHRNNGCCGIQLAHGYREGSRETDHAIFRPVAKEHVEIVEIAPCGTEDQDIARLRHAAAYARAACLLAGQEQNRLVVLVPQRVLEVIRLGS